ncbi:MAG: Hsp20 family protein, partial [Bdellovibrionales bacterium]|nr:Hsp20 family protein [Bdellovibrionales bacterium]
HSPVAEEKVNAHYEDGVLTIKVPKLKPTKSREIKIH